MEKTMDKIVALAKARGFVYPGSEIYGGLANTWDYGNLGVELKNNVICTGKSLQCRRRLRYFDESPDMGGIRASGRFFRSAYGL